MRKNLSAIVLSIVLVGFLDSVALVPLASVAAGLADAPTMVRAGLGLSSISFWCLRWIEHSRSPTWMAFPCASQSTCTSMWRPPVR